MTWRNPIPDFKLVPTADPESYRKMPWWPEMTTGIPVLPGIWPGDGPNNMIYNTSNNWYDHPGAFGVKRKHDVHTGVDLYVLPGTLVRAVEDGQVVRTGYFTGTKSDPPTPWWNETGYIMVEGASGVVCYGEIDPSFVVPMDIRADDLIGRITPVLKKDKGRPMSMLHIELYEHGYRGEPVDWPVHATRRAPCPAGLLDPTPFLLELCE